MHTYHVVGPFIISCNRDHVYLKVTDDHNEEFEVQATQNIAEASKFYIVRLDERNYFNIVYEYSSERGVRRQLERQCGRSKPAVSMYLCAPVNWRGKMQRNKPLRMQLSGKASHTRMALHSRKSKSFQPVKLTEWISEKEVFFISCQERSVSKLKGSYLCVYAQENLEQISRSETTENAAPDDKPLIQDDKPNKELGMTTDKQENEPKQESTGTGIEQSDNSEPSNSENTTQGQESKAENEIESMDQADQEVEKGTESKSRRKAAKKIEEDESESMVQYHTGCEPDIKKHNDKDVFMLFRLLKPDLEKQGM